MQIYVRLSKIAQFSQSSFNIILNTSFIFEKLPRFIVALSFFFDVCILHQFYYFWKLIPLLLVTLIFQCIRYIIQQWAQEVGDECENLL